jgi:hypothetical protein
LIEREPTIESCKRSVELDHWVERAYWASLAQEPDCEWENSYRLVYQPVDLVELDSEAYFPILAFDAAPALLL